MTIRVFLADDHTVVRDGLRMLLEAQPDLQVVGEAENGRDAVRQIERLAPDVAIVDVAMPELNGLEVARQVLETSPGTQIIVLSMYSSSTHVNEALRVGVKGYLRKASAGASVVDAVRAVHNGRRYLSPQILDQVIERSLNPNPSADENGGPLARLTPREREVLQLVAEGHTSAQIAHRLHLAPKTIETYRSTLMRKLEIDNLASLVKFAIQQGLTPLD